MNVMVVAPHPDDEALGCGGAIRLHADRGDAVVIVFLTSGEAGLPESPPAAARLMREDEARCAADVLGAVRLEFLRFPDGAMETRVDEAAIALAELIDATRPTVMYMPHAGENHADH